MKSDADLLREYAMQRSETAFTEIVIRHTDLVYSAAWRQTGSPELAREIAQSVFTDLAGKACALACTLSAGASLGGWLYRATRFAALTRLRDETRRAAREKQAMEFFNPVSDTTPNWQHVAPVLDEAMSELSDDDREAVLLRYFQKQDFRSVGLALGMNDDAAQKRVSRAVERLRECLARRGITIGANGLIVIITANAVQTAPAGLAVTLGTFATVAGTTAVSTATTKVGNAIAMTTLQKTIITGTLVAALGTGIYEAHQASTLRRQVQNAVPLAHQILELTAERDDALSRLAALREGNAPTSAERSELLRLRAEVSRLRDEQNDLQRLRSDAASAASKEPKIAFQHRFLSRSTWTNAGLLTPEHCLETFLWAWTSKDDAAILKASARDTNGQPISLTGISTDYRDRLMGAQILTFNAGPNPNALDAVTATIVTELLMQTEDQNGRLFEEPTHGILKLRLVKSDGEWRFAGMLPRY